MLKMLNGNDLVYETLKEKVKELGCEYRLDSDVSNIVSSQGNQGKGFIHYFDDDSFSPYLFLNPDLPDGEKEYVMALLVAHAMSFLGKDFKVDLLITSKKLFLLQEDSVIGKWVICEVPALYKAHLTELAYSLIDSAGEGIYGKAA